MTFFKNLLLNFVRKTFVDWSAFGKVSAKIIVAVSMYINCCPLVSTKRRLCAYDMCRKTGAYVVM